jgi:3-methylcrotonyl-CoA carboxylase alpha subunit
MSARRLSVRAAGGEITAAVDTQGHVEVDGATYAARETWPGTWHVTTGGRTSLVHVARDEAGYWVHAEGQVFRLDMSVAGGRRAARRVESHDGGLTAPMPATVRAVLVEVGQAVRAGDTVVMLEAMKMELPIRAPRDGAVAAVHCREGQLVQPGVPLVEIA